MTERSTLEETSTPAKRAVGVLAVVLRYDDLCADASRTFRLGSGPTFSLGRAPEGATDIVASAEALLLPDGWASGRHATLRLSPDTGVCLVEDEGSRNGTYVNGERIQGKERLFDGDLVEVGHTLLCFRMVDESALGALLDPAGAPRLGPTRTRSPELVALARDLERIAPTRQPILVLGETGTGKEVVATAVHAASGRSGELCAVDCGAVPESLFEATFFGHRRGAFTGAAEARAGEIARADGGTLFLDEAGNMSPACQAKLLRVLEQGRVTPLGAAEPLRVDVRWVAASNVDPFGRGGSSFRGDFAQRLAGYVARLPPLRRRREDLGALAAHCLREIGVTSAAITAAAARRLFADPFSGNVRQLRSMLQTAAYLASQAPIAGGSPTHVAIDVGHLPSTEPGDEPDELGGAADARPGVAGARLAPPAPAARRGAPDATTIEAALAATGGNVIRAATALDVRPRQLYRWIERFGVALDAYRDKG